MDFSSFYWIYFNKLIRTVYFGFLKRSLTKNQLMDIYQEKSNWKIYLVIMGVLILTASLIYTTSVANKLKEGERQKIEKWI